jgi:hypothetical protein
MEGDDFTMPWDMDAQETPGARYASIKEESRTSGEMLAGSIASIQRKQMVTRMADEGVTAFAHHWPKSAASSPKLSNVTPR